MMKINGFNGTNTQTGVMGMAQANDSVSKNIQNQIANAQQKLQDLSSNEELSLEDKMKKRQEIQQEITNLNQQLRQHQIEQRKEQQSKKSSMDDMVAGTKNTSAKKGTGLSQAGMRAMISADSSMKQAKVQGSMATQMEGRAGVLESEIKQDAGKGNTEDVYKRQRDTLTISASGKEKLTKSTSGRTHNTSIDSSIDLKSYIASAKKTNQELIENAGTQINAKTSEYMSTGKAFRAALTEKYSNLAGEAKTHSNPENYIHSKYFDKSSEYNESNLTDTERRIAYNYEMQMCRTGKINGVNYQDSLFRGIEVDGDSVDSDKIQFERALVNSQISNILKQAGVDTSSITKDCTFTVDPYLSLIHIYR